MKLFTLMLIDTVTCLPAMWAIVLGLESMGLNLIGQVVGAALLLTLNNAGRNFTNCTRNTKNK